MKRSRITARVISRAIFWTFATIGVAFEIISLATNNVHLGHVGQSIFTTNAVLLLWSWASEHKERLDELTRRENNSYDRDTTILARLVELMDSAWRNDPTYREQRQKREATEKYLRDMKEKTDK